MGPQSVNWPLHELGDVVRGKDFVMVPVEGRKSVYGFSCKQPAFETLPLALEWARSVCEDRSLARVRAKAAALHEANVAALAALLDNDPNRQTALPG